MSHCHTSQVPSERAGRCLAAAGRGWRESHSIWGLALDNLPGFVGGFSLAALLGQRRISRSVELTAAPAPTGTWEMDAFGDQVPCVGVTGSAPTPRAIGRA